MFETGTSGQEAGSDFVWYRSFLPLELLNISALSHKSQRSSFANCSDSDTETPTNKIYLTTFTVLLLFAVLLNTVQLIIVLYIHSKPIYEVHDSI